uniref:SDR family NAD(P)-dependent oxidoreductase n=1 Tax=Neorhizobium sp. EC2-8 TaxID=3129230 RepID=UPI0031010C5E
MEFENKTIVITGAAGIFGRWTAAYFAREGARLCLSDVRMDGLEKAVAELGLDRSKVLLHATELTSDASMLELVDLVKREWRAPDILVNNAGIYTRFSLLEMEFSDWDRVFGVNLRAPFVLSREFAKLMIAEDKKARSLTFPRGPPAR